VPEGSVGRINGLSLHVQRQHRPSNARRKVLTQYRSINPWYAKYQAAVSQLVLDQPGLIQNHPPANAQRQPCPVNLIPCEALMSVPFVEVLEEIRVVLVAFLAATRTRFACTLLRHMNKQTTQRIAACLEACLRGAQLTDLA
jgi:hypothetical protein